MRRRGRILLRLPKRSIVLHATGRELVEVLEHYEDEPEKLEAAKFLISNMHGHYSYQSTELDSLEMFLAQLTQGGGFFFTPEQLKRWEKFSLINLPRKDDLPQCQRRNAYREH